MDPSRPQGHPAVPLRVVVGTTRLLNPPPDPDRRTRPELPDGWLGVWAAVLGFCAGLLLSALTASIADAATGYSPSSAAALPVPVTVANLLGLWAGLLGAAVWYSRVRGTGRLAPDFGLRVGRWWDLPLGAAVGLGCQYGLVRLLYLPFEHVDRSLSHQLGEPTARDTGAAHSDLAVAVLLAFLALGAPIVEELFFRGLLMRSLARVSSPPVAVLGSALLFGLAHFEALQFAGLAAVGVVFGVLAWWTGRLGPSVGAHMAFNAVAVVTATHLH